MSANNEAQPAPLVYTVEQAAAVLGIGRNAVYEEIARGQLKSFTHGRRRRIAHADLVAFINALRKASDPVRSPPSLSARRNAANRGVRA